MVDQQTVLDYMREDAYRPTTFEELEMAFVITEDEDRKALRTLFANMEEEGLIVRTRTHRFGVPERMDLVVGRLQVKARGFGFVVPAQDGEADVYIGAMDMAGAMDGDKVIARPKKGTGGSRREGEIIRVVQRAHHALVGVLTTHGGYGFVKPDDKHLNQDLFIAGEHLMGAVDGQKVVIDITEYPGVNGVQSAAGKVVEILGFPNDPGVDILAIVRKYGIPEAFPSEVLQAAELVPNVAEPEEIERRRDLRDEVIVTIDGADAKDLDDAVHVKLLENGNYLLGVHIADVSHYVREGSLLDKEAYARGTSVYLVDRVIPMLPPRLSNGICSLHPHVDRLTLTCEMEWSQDLQLIRHDIYPSVIRTTERMTYDAVKGILTGTDADASERYRELIPLFQLMEKLAMALRQRRMARGAVDFDLPETKIKVDAEGKPLELVLRERSIAEMIIEEFMLAANETVAEHFFWLEVPFLYRVHEAPTQEKMLALNEFVHNFGYHLKAVGNPHPRALQDLLEKVRGQKEAVVISHLTLRSMKQARYSQESLGHFGLATEYYSHFTSPIRRYPDLMIHRIIREVLAGGGLLSNRHAYLTAIMPEVASQCSERERNAVDAERETDLVKKIEYMMDKVGEEFEGMISGATGFGLFVQLDNSVEGLIHISYLEDDYYHYHEHVHALIGERLKRTFRIGDRLRVRVLAANKQQLAIDFGLVEKLSGDDVDVLEQANVSASANAPGGVRFGGSGSGRAGSVRAGGGGSSGGRAGGGSGRAGSGSGRASGGSGRADDGRAGGGSGRADGQWLGGARNGDGGGKRSGSGGGRASGVRQGHAARSGSLPISLSNSDSELAEAGRKRKKKKGGKADNSSKHSLDIVGSVVGDMSTVADFAAGAVDRHAVAVAITDDKKSGRAKKTKAPSGGLLPSKGGYAKGIAATDENPRERRRKEQDALRDIAQTYGVPVKDKSRKRKPKPL